MDLFDDFNVSVEGFFPPALDIDNDRHEADALINTALSLESMLSEIKRTGAVSRTQAQYLSTECGVNFGPNYPLAGFTEQPTPVNYQIALEGATMEFFTSIGAFIKKVVRIIINILKWIWDFLMGNSKRKDGAKTALENISEVNKTNKEVEEIMARHGNDVRKQAASHGAGQPQEMPNAEGFKRYADECVRWEKEWNNLRANVLTHSHLRTMLNDYADQFAAFLPFVQRRVEVLEEIFKEDIDPSNMAKMAEFNQRFLRAAKNLPVRSFLMILGKGGFAPNTNKPEEEMTYLDVATMLSEIIADEISSNDFHIMTPDMALERMMADKNVGESLLTHSETEAKVLNGIIKDYEKLVQKAPRQSYTEQLRELYQKLIDSMAQEVRGLQITVQAYGNADQEVGKMIKNLGDCVFNYNLFLEGVLEQMPDMSADDKRKTKDLIKHNRQYLKRVGR